MWDYISTRYDFMRLSELLSQRDLVEKTLREGRPEPVAGVATETDWIDDPAGTIRHLAETHLALTKQIQRHYEETRLEDGMTLQHALIRHSTLKILCRIYMLTWREYLSKWVPTDVLNIDPAVMRRSFNPRQKELRLLTDKIRRAIHQSGAADSGG